MLKRLRQTKYVEEILGLIGLLYIVGLILVSFFLVKFLVQASFTSLGTTAKGKVVPPTFQIEMAKKALER